MRAEEFQSRVVTLIAHLHDETVPMPEFSDQEKPMVQALLAKLVLMDPDLKAAVDRHNARHMSLEQVVLPVRRTGLVAFAHQISTSVGQGVANAALLAEAIAHLPEMYRQLAEARQTA